MNAERASLGYRSHKAQIWAGETPDKYLRVARYVSGRNVLEVGSAEGVLALELAKGGHRVTAVELRVERHQEALKLAAERACGLVRFVCGDLLDNLELLLGIDTLVAVRSIYYLREHAARVFEEAHAVGVKEVVLCGNRNRAAQAAAEPHTDLGRFNRLASHDGMADLVTAAGFHVVQMVGAGDPDRGGAALTDAIRVSPFAVTHKLSCDLDETEAAQWPSKTYAPLEQTIKHRAMMQRYRDGRRWEDTELFTDIYTRRFARGGEVRGCRTIEELARQYYGRVDAMAEDLRRRGFREVIDGEPTTFPVLVGPGGTLVIGNQGNHRLAMAKALNLASVLVVVRGELTDVNVEYEPVDFKPELHAGARAIPAMTTVAERMAYYELARQAAGTVVELGTWLGAASVFLAAGIRDAGAGCLHAYDRFEWTELHSYKAGAAITQPMHAVFKENLGPLAPLVEIHRGEIAHAKWSDGPIAVLIADGPKRMSDIVRTLQQFGPSLGVGSHMAWQDFAYFPAYDIPVCLDALEQAGQIALVDSVYPGTTAVFKVTAAIDTQVIRPISEWRAHQIVKTWERWRDRLQPPMRPRWMCGAAMFLCDRKAERMAADLFRVLLAEHREEIAPKWQYLKDKRPTVAKKYTALVKVLDDA